MDIEYAEFDYQCMSLALHEAKLAYENGEVPVGAVLAHDRQIITSSHNQVERLKDATAHAEVLCLQKATKFFGDWRLTSSTLYVTLEPCSMCAGAAILSRLKKIIYGAPDLRHGAAGSWVNLFESKHPIHKVAIEFGLLAEESKELMQQFFRERRECKSTTPYLKN